MYPTRLLSCLASGLALLLLVTSKLHAQTQPNLRRLPTPSSFSAYIEVSQHGSGTVQVSWSLSQTNQTKFTVRYIDSRGVDVQIHPKESLFPGIFNAINNLPQTIDLRKLADRRSANPNDRELSSNGKRAKVQVGDASFSGYQISVVDTSHPSEYSVIEKIYETIVTRIVGRKAGDYYMPANRPPESKPEKVDTSREPVDDKSAIKQENADHNNKVGAPKNLDAFRVIECPDTMRAKRRSGFGRGVYLRDFNTEQVKAMGLPPGSDRFLVVTAPGVNFEKDEGAGTVVIIDPEDSKRLVKWNPTEKALVYREGRLVEESFTQMGYGNDLSFSADGAWCLIGTSRGGKAFLRNLNTNAQTTLSHHLFQGHTLIAGQWLPDNPVDSPWRRDRNAGVTGVFCGNTDFFLLGKGETQATLILVGSTSRPDELFLQRRASQAADPARTRDVELLAATTGQVESLRHGSRGTADGHMVFAEGHRIYRHAGDRAEYDTPDSNGFDSIKSDAAWERMMNGGWGKNSTFEVKGMALKDNKRYSLITAISSGRARTFIAEGDLSTKMKRLIEVCETPTAEFYRGIACGIFARNGKDYLWAALHVAAPTTGRNRIVIVDVETGNLSAFFPNDHTGKPLILPDDVSCVVDGSKGHLYIGIPEICFDERAARHGRSGVVFSYDIGYLIPGG